MAGCKTTLVVTVSDNYEMLPLSKWLLGSDQGLVKAFDWCAAAHKPTAQLVLTLWRWDTRWGEAANAAAVCKK